LGIIGAVQFSGASVALIIVLGVAVSISASLGLLFIPRFRAIRYSRRIRQVPAVRPLSDGLNPDAGSLRRRQSQGIAGSPTAGAHVFVDDKGMIIPAGSPGGPSPRALGQSQAAAAVREATANLTSATDIQLLELQVQAKELIGALTRHDEAIQTELYRRHPNYSSIADNGGKNEVMMIPGQIGGYAAPHSSPHLSVPLSFNHPDNLVGGTGVTPLSPPPGMMAFPTGSASTAQPPFVLGPNIGLAAGPLGSTSDVLFPAPTHVNNISNNAVVTGAGSSTDVGSGEAVQLPIIGAP
jgi:hypothetical protein